MPGRFFFVLDFRPSNRPIPTKKGIGHRATIYLGTTTNLAFIQVEGARVNHDPSFGSHVRWLLLESFGLENGAFPAYEPTPPRARLCIHHPSIRSLTGESPGDSCPLTWPSLPATPERSKLGDFHASGKILLKLLEWFFCLPFFREVRTWSPYRFHLVDQTAKSH